METNTYQAYSLPVSQKQVKAIKWILRFLFPALALGMFSGCDAEEELPAPAPINANARQAQAQVINLASAQSKYGKVYTARCTVADGICFRSVFSNNLLFLKDGGLGDYLQPYYTTVSLPVALDERYEVRYQHVQAMYPFPGDDPESIYCQSAPIDMEYNQAIRVLQLKRIP